MTGDEHREWEGSVASYVLGALPAVERDGFERHLEGCEHCRQDVDRLGGTVDALALSPEPVDPPPELRNRLLATVRREAELLAAAGADADRPEESAPRAGASWWRRAIPTPVVAAALTCVLALGVLAGVLLQGSDDTTTPGTPEQAVQVVQADVRSESFPRARAALAMTGDRGELRVTGFGNPGPGRVWQVWRQEAGGAVEGTDALFTVDRTGRADVGVPGRMEGVEAVMVTSEPLGGSAAPSSAPVIVARPS